MHPKHVPVLLCALLPATTTAASAPRRLLAQDFPAPSVVPVAGGYVAFATTSPAGTVEDRP